MLYVILKNEISFNLLGKNYHIPADSLVLLDIQRGIIKHDETGIGIDVNPTDYLLGN
jgi:hypothetical protein